MPDEITTLLGKESMFEGKLQFDGVVRIDGSYRGEIRSEGTLVLGPSAEVEAEIEVRSCVIEGNFSGNLKATESVEIHAPAKVKGTVTTPEIQVERGVLLDGKCTMESASSKEQTSGGEPSRANRTSGPENEKQSAEKSAESAPASAGRDDSAAGSAGTEKKKKKKEEKKK